MRARCEDSESAVQQLQTQLVELQKRDTLLRAREQKDAIVSSLRQRCTPFDFPPKFVYEIVPFSRHESELASYKEELDTMTRLRSQLERKVEEYQVRENAVAKSCWYLFFVFRIHTCAYATRG